jgi:hypothetical protein
MPDNAEPPDRRVDPSSTSLPLFSTEDQDPAWPESALVRAVVIAEVDDALIIAAAGNG